MQQLPFGVGLEARDHHVVISVRGEVDLATVDRVRELLEEATCADAAEVWVDLTDAGFMDSTGLSALVEAHQRLQRRLVVICPADGEPRRAIEIAGLHRIIRVYRDADEAQAS
jgi:anti-sigma B factor antagonist